ncbi:MAG: hypothetical protein ACE5MI_07710 [Acidimicrobiia bacterium]
MKSDIGTQVSHYGRYLDEVAPPVTVHELQDLAEPAAFESRRPPRRRGWKIALVAGAAVLLAGLVTVLAFQLADEQPPVVTEPPPTTTIEPGPDVSALIASVEGSLVEVQAVQEIAGDEAGSVTVGFVVDDAGHVLVPTSSWDPSSARLRVVTRDGLSRPAVILARDQDAGVALSRQSPPTWSPLA